MSVSDPVPEGFVPTNFGRKIPFSEHFFPTYEKLTDRGVIIGARVVPECCNAGAMAHGAFLMALGDYATTRATFAAVGTDNRFTVHINFTMNFYAPAVQGTWLEARADVERTGKSIIFVSCNYFADDEPIGHAQAVLKSSVRRTPSA